MIPPYTYAAGRMAEERREDAIRMHAHTRLMHKARPVSRKPLYRLVARIGDLLIPGDQSDWARRAPVPRELRA